MKYESSIFNSSTVMSKVKVFVYAANTNADGRAMTLASRTFVWLANNMEYHVNLLLLIYM